MNNRRRKEIKQLIKANQEIIDTLQCNVGILSDLRDEEDECLNNLPENLQNSYRADDFSNSVDALDNAIDAFDNVLNDLAEVNDAMSTAIL